MALNSKKRKDQEQRLRDLISKDWPQSIIEAQTLVDFGILVDLSEDLGSEEGLKRALDLASKWEKAENAENLWPIFYYMISNANYALWYLRHPNDADKWVWIQPEIEDQVWNLHRCIDDPGFPSIPKDLQCRAYTNLGNALSRIGRPVEAIREWQAALALDKDFPDAVVNHGIGLAYYGSLVPDHGHAGLISKRAYDILRPLDPNTMDKPLRNEVSKSLGMIRQRWKLEFLDRPAPSFGPGRVWEDDEKEYRDWAQSEHLFLNSLTEIGLDNLSGRDTMCVPTMRYGIDQRPWANPVFNELKQEYVSARYLIWAGTHRRERHWSDRDVTIVNSLDYPAVGLNTQQLRSGYRMAYSLLDKVAGFLNHYLELKIPEHTVSFSSIWTIKIDGKYALPLMDIENWPLRGLYWLSRDFFKSGASHRPLDPEARRLWKIRQFIEHKVLKIHDLDLTPIDLDEAVRRAGVAAGFSLSVTRNELERLSVGLLRRVRAALIHLLMAIHGEEGKRAANTPRDEFVPQMHEEIFEDEWKD